MEILKKTYSKNNNEIVLVEKKSKIPLKSPKTVLIIGVVHGEEPQGKFLIENYLKQETPAGQNRLLFIPCLNPDGFETNKRQNANGIDLNRNFPTKNRGRVNTKEVNAGVNGGKCEGIVNVSDNSEYFGGNTPASEIETKFVIEILEEFSPDIIITLHSPFRLVNYDGPAQKIAQKIADILDYPLTDDIGYPTLGSLGTYAGVERNIPIITIEFDEKTDVKDLINPANKIFELLLQYESFNITK